MKLLLVPVVAASLLLGGCVGYSEAKIKKDTVSLATTAEQRQLAAAQEKSAKNPLAQLGGYLDAAGIRKTPCCKATTTSPWPA